MKTLKIAIAALSVLMMLSFKQYEYDNGLSTVKVHIPDTFHNDEIHIICEVHDNSKYTLPAYRRIIIRTE